MGFPRGVTLHHIPLMRVLKYVLSDGCAPEEALIDASWVFFFFSLLAEQLQLRGVLQFMEE